MNTRSSRINTQSKHEKTSTNSWPDPFENLQRRLTSLKVSSSFPSTGRVENVVSRASRSRWYSMDFANIARESAKGLSLAYENRMPKQANHHLIQMERALSVNSAHLAIVTLQYLGLNAKPFAICNSTGRRFEVNGDGYTWKVESVDDSDEAIPSEFLERVSLLRANDLEPDECYIAVPHQASKPTTSDVVKNELKSAFHYLVKTTGAVALGFAQVAATVVMPDPVLLAGYGENPRILVEIGRWE